MGQATDLLGRIQNQRGFLSDEDIEALRTLDWGKAADAEARQGARDDQDYWACKSGVLTSYCGALARELASQSDRYRKRMSELGRLKVFADAVEDLLRDGSIEPDSEESRVLSELLREHVHAEERDALGVRG
ncbi:MAG TPA: hypothetical protein VKA48_10770 [Gammaproteobacteria bacterium]|nr:hypothetical protein [Gammaproteobacteria bacterium]